MEDRHYPHYLHPLARRLGKTYSVVETGMKELTVKGINNQHNKTYQFDRSESCTCVEKLSSCNNKMLSSTRVFGPKSEQIHVYRSVVEPLLEEANILFTFSLVHT